MSAYMHARPGLVDELEDLSLPEEPPTMRNLELSEALASVCAADFWEQEHKSFERILAG